MTSPAATNPAPETAAERNDPVDPPHPCIVPVRAFSDNFIWMLASTGTHQAIVVDPGDFERIQKSLECHRLSLAAVLLTHHHNDHLGGVTALLERWPEARVFGPTDPRCDPVHVRVAEGERFHTPGLPLNVTVLAVPGHTRDHIAFLVEPFGGDPRTVLFCGDTMFAAGCGRLFEGTAVQMGEALQRFARLPVDTLVYCAHEYTLSNLVFAHTMCPADPAIAGRLAEVRALRSADRDTVPTSIGRELATNLFLQAAAQGDFGQLAHWRLQKDSFRG